VPGVRGSPEELTLPQEETRRVSSCTSFRLKGASGKLPRMARRPSRLRARANWAARWVGRLACCAVLGVLATVLAAWLAVARAPDLHPRTRPIVARGWFLATPDGWPASPDSSYLVSSFGWVHLVQETTAPLRPGVPTAGADCWQLGVMDAGWPLPALRASYSSEPPRTVEQMRRAGGMGILMTQTGIECPPSLCRAENNIRLLGTIPIWRGLLLDAHFFAATFLALGAVPALTRRVLRRAPGQCASCRYDLSGLPPGSPCPECAALPSPPHH
jgi:hypothetical protein